MIDYHLYEQFIVIFLVATCACCHSSNHCPSKKNLAQSSLGTALKPPPLSILLLTSNKACARILPGPPVTSLTDLAAVDQKAVWLTQLKQFKTKEEKDHWHIPHVIGRRQSLEDCSYIKQTAYTNWSCIHKWLYRKAFAMHDNFSWSNLLNKTASPSTSH